MNYRLVIYESDDPPACLINMAIHARSKQNPATLPTTIAAILSPVSVAVAAPLKAPLRAPTGIFIRPIDVRIYFSSTMVLTFPVFSELLDRFLIVGGFCAVEDFSVLSKESIADRPSTTFQTINPETQQDCPIKYFFTLLFIYSVFLLTKDKIID